MKKPIRIALFALVMLAALGAAPKADAWTSFNVGFGYYPHYRSYYPYYYGGPGYFYGWAYSHPYYPYGGYYGGGYGPYYAYAYGEVRLEVKPKDAKVYVDGDYAGTADDFDGWWQRLKINPGRHRIVVREQGFAPYGVTIRVVPGSDDHIKVQLQPGQDEVANTFMRPERDPNERDDSQYAPRQQDDRDREYDRRPPESQNQYQPSPGYGNDSQYGGNQDNRAPMDNRGPIDGRKLVTLQVQPSDATIYIDGDYYGTGDSGEAQIQLSTGTHKIEVVRPGFESYEKSINVGENSNDKISIFLQKK